MDEAGPRGIAGEVVGGLAWSLAGQLVLRSGTFVTGIVLAHLLVPEDFGVYAVGLAVTEILLAANDLGVIQTTIRWPEPDLRPVAGVGALVAPLTSLVLVVSTCIAAGGIADGLGIDDAAGVIRVLSLTIIVDGLVAVPSALLVRRFRQDLVSAGLALGTVVYAAVAVSVAVTGGGVWSFVAGRLAGSVATALFYWFRAPERPRPSWPPGWARRVVRFGAPIAFAGLVTQAVLSLDYLVVGAVLGSTALGVYLLAFNVASWPVSILRVAVARVALAGFARLAPDRDRLRDGFLYAEAVTATFVVPIVTVLWLVAPEIVDLIYGERWSGAVGPLRILLVLGAARVVLELFSDLLVADGRPGALVPIQVAWFVVLLPALVIGAHQGDLDGVAEAHLVVLTVVVTPAFLHAARPVGVRGRDLLAAAARPLLAGAASVLAMLAARALLDSEWGRLLVLPCVGTAAYALAVYPGNTVLRRLVASARRQEPAQER